MSNRYSSKHENARPTPELIAKAEELGKKAFKSGMKRVPFDDNALEELQGESHGTIGYVEIFWKAWLKGWDKANIAAPVKKENAKKSEWFAMLDKHMYMWDRAGADRIRGHVNVDRYFELEAAVMKLGGAIMKKKLDQIAGKEFVEIKEPKQLTENARGVTLDDLHRAYQKYADKGKTNSRYSSAVEGVKPATMTRYNSAHDNATGGAVVGKFKDGSASVFLPRKEYDKTIPWSGEALSLSKLAKRTDSLAGLTYHFKDSETMAKFLKAIGA